MEKHIRVSTECLFNGYVTVAGSAVRTKQEKHREGAPAEVGLPIYEIHDHVYFFLSILRQT